MQVKLLRAIQEKSIRSIGNDKETPVDVRILSATHKDLGALVEQGEFRQDLYYRVNVIELPLPKLSARKEDIQLLVRHILEKLAKQHRQVKIELSDQALKALTQYRFPGNVRELENILERAFTLCENQLIQEADIQLSHIKLPPSAPTPDNNLSRQPSPPSKTIWAVWKKKPSLTHWKKHVGTKRPPLKHSALPFGHYAIA